MPNADTVAWLGMVADDAAKAEKRRLAAHAVEVEKAMHAAALQLAHLTVAEQVTALAFLCGWCAWHTDAAERDFLADKAGRAYIGGMRYARDVQTRG